MDWSPVNVTVVVVLPLRDCHLCLPLCCHLLIPLFCFVKASAFPIVFLAFAFSSHGNIDVSHNILHHEKITVLWHRVNFFFFQFLQHNAFCIRMCNSSTFFNSTITFFTYTSMLPIWNCLLDYALLYAWILKKISSGILCDRGLFSFPSNRDIFLTISNSYIINELLGTKNASVAHSSYIFFIIKFFEAGCCCESLLD